MRDCVCSPEGETDAVARARLDGPHTLSVDGVAVWVTGAVEVALLRGEVSPAG